MVDTAYIGVRSSPEIRDLYLCVWGGVRVGVPGFQRYVNVRYVSETRGDHPVRLDVIRHLDTGNRTGNAELESQCFTY